MDKKIVSFLVLFFALIPFCYGQENQEEKDGFKWTKTRQGKIVAAYDEFGNEIIPASKGFDFIFYEANPEGDSYGYFRVSKGSNYGVCDVMGNEIIPVSKGFDYISYERSRGGDNYSYYSVTKGKQHGVYDVEGNEIVPVSKGFKYIFYEPNPDGDSYGYFRVQMGSKYGAYDVMGNEVIPPISKFPINGIYNVKTADGKKVKCAIGNDGKLIIPTERGYTEIIKDEDSFYKGYYEVSVQKKRGVCDLQGNEIIPPRYKAAYFSKYSGCFIVQEGKKRAHLDLSLDYDGNVCSKSLRDSLDNNMSIEELFQKAYNLPESDYMNKQSLYRKVIALDPDNSKGLKLLAYNNIGATWEARDQPKLAKEYYQLAIDTDPTFELASENLARAKKAAREKKWNSVINTLGAIGGVLNTASNIVNAVSGNAAAVSVDGSTFTSSTNRNSDVDALDAKAAKAKEDARLTPLKNRDSNVYQDYEGQLSSMKVFPERYDDQQRRTIQLKMKQIRTKWEQKGFKMYHSEWENWDGSH